MAINHLTLFVFMKKRKYRNNPIYLDKSTGGSFCLILKKRKPKVRNVQTQPHALGLDKLT